MGHILLNKVTFIGRFEFLFDCIVSLCLKMISAGKKINLEWYLMMIIGIAVGDFHFFVTPIS